MKTDLKDFYVSKRSHWKVLQPLAHDLYGRKVEIDNEPLKRYQDLFALKFIQENISKGSRILEIGGADSRILKKISSDYECWNLDKLEGLGNGPKVIGNHNYKLVRDYIGNFNSSLPEGYFDLIFSISVLEHINDEGIFLKIIKDIQRLLSPNAISLQLFDMNYLPSGGVWVNGLGKLMIDMYLDDFSLQELSKFANDPDLYFMSKRAFDKYWFPFIKLSYAEYGRPSCLNIIWSN